MTKATLPPSLTHLIADARAAWRALHVARSNQEDRKVELQKYRSEKDALIADYKVVPATAAKRLSELEFLIARTERAINANNIEQRWSEAAEATRRAAGEAHSAREYLYNYTVLSRAAQVRGSLEEWAGKDADFPHKLLWDLALYDPRVSSFGEAYRFNLNSDYRHMEEPFEVLAKFLEERADEYPAALSWTRATESHRKFCEENRKATACLPWEYVGVFPNIPSAELQPIS